MDCVLIFSVLVFRKLSLRRKKAIRPEDLETVLSKIQNNDLIGLRKCLAAFTDEDRREIFYDERLEKSLHLCLSHGNLDMMEDLLKIAPEIVDIVDEEGLTVLYRAAHLKKTHIVKRLLDFGASVQVTEEALQSASCCYDPLMHEVVKSNDLELIRRVTEAGADVKAMTAVGLDCLKTAADHCTLDAFQYVREKCGKTECAPSVETLAIKAFHAGHMDVVAELLKEKHDKRLLTQGLILHVVSTANRDHSEVITLLKEIGGETNEIIFHEVAGAGYIRFGELQEGIEAWMTAMRLRWKDPNSPHLKMPKDSSLVEILQTAEVQTVADVENLPLNQMELLKQAGLVLQRHVPGWAACIDTLLCVAENLILAGEVLQGMKILDRFCSRFRTRSSLFLRKSVTLLRLAARTKPQEVTLKRCLLKLTHCRKLVQRSLDDVRPDVAREHDATSRQAGHCYSCSQISAATKSFVETLSILFVLEKSATLDEKKELHSELTKFVLVSSKHRHEVLFHDSVQWVQFLDPAAMKTLVAFSHALALQGKTSGPLHLTRDRKGQTPLHVYAQTWYKKALVEDGVLECLLEHGADLCTTDDNGESIRDVLVRRGFVTAEEVLPTLKCLAARKVAQMPSELLPCIPGLRDFVLKH